MTESPNETKVCSKCRVVKPLEDFQCNRTTFDGRQYWCPTCKKEYDKQKWQDPAYRARSHMAGKRWSEENPEQHRASMVAGNRTYRRRNPKKITAQQKLRNTVQSGTLDKPDKCERCRNRVSVNDLHGHHEDYAKPLDVEWLCRQCHVEHHRVENEIARQ